MVPGPKPGCRDVSSTNCGVSVNSGGTVSSVDSGSSDGTRSSDCGSNGDRGGSATSSDSGCSVCGVSSGSRR
jgi:hypothetical protein